MAQSAVDLVLAAGIAASTSMHRPTLLMMRKIARTVSVVRPMRGSMGSDS